MMPIVAEAPENPRVAACSHTPPREHCTICLSKPLHARSAGLCEARPRRMPRTSLEKTRSAERWLLSRSDLGRAERMAW